MKTLTTLLLCVTIYLSLFTPLCPIVSDTLSSTLYSRLFFSSNGLESYGRDNILDLVLMTAPDMLFHIAVYEGLGDCYHNSIEFKLSL